MLTEPPPTRSLKFETDRRGLRSNILFARLGSCIDLLEYFDVLRIFRDKTSVSINDPNANIDDDKNQCCEKYRNGAR